ncbi:hypothetical protein [Caulobacter mirabilis]|nr:hypothetical protein [Caulobacter mirabilis]
MKFNLWAFLQCLFNNGHEFTNSKSRRGYVTCVHCGFRKRWR